MDAEEDAEERRLTTLTLSVMCETSLCAFVIEKERERERGEGRERE